MYLQQTTTKTNLIAFIILYVIHFNTQNREHFQIIVTTTADMA